YEQRYGLPARTLPVTAENMVTFVRVTLHNTGPRATTAVFGASLTPDGVTQGQPQPGPPLPTTPGWDATTGALGGDGRLLLTATGHPTWSAGRLSWSVPLGPGDSYTIGMKVPYWVAQQADLAPFAAADPDAYQRRTEAFWRDTLQGAGTHLTVPDGGLERKV